MGNLYMRFPDGKKKALTLSYDDGAEQDRKLISLMRLYGIRGTFNLNSALYQGGGRHRRLPREEALKLYRGNDVEVACHGLTHALCGDLPYALCLKEIHRDRENLENMFDCFVRGFAYPGGGYKKEVFDCMRTAGIVYGRTVQASHGFSIPQDWYCWNPTCHHDDPELMPLAERFVEEPVDWGSRLFFIWGHSYELEEKNSWNQMEELFLRLGGRKDTWYATNLEVYEYVNSYRQLVFSAAGDAVWNPTARKIWLETDGRIVCVDAGGKARIS